MRRDIAIKTITTLIFLIFGSLYLMLTQNLKYTPSLNIKKNNAGCLIVNNEGKFLLVKGAKTLKWHIPGGTGNIGESSWETAEREGFEEIGVPVIAKELFKRQDNGFYLYWCDLIGNLDLNYFLPDETLCLAWIDIDKMQENQLRYPKEYKNLFKEIKMMMYKNLISVYVSK